MAPKTDVGAWMKFFPADWIAGTRMLPPLARAAYIDLLCSSWEHGSIPDDPKLLWRFCSMSFEEFAEAWQHLRCKWELHPTEQGRLVNPKQESVRSGQEDRVRGGKKRMAGMTPEERRAMGKQGADARWGNASDASSMPAGCQHPYQQDAGDSGLRTQEERESVGGSQVGDLAVHLAEHTIDSYRIASGQRHALEHVLLAHLKALVGAGMEPEKSVEALERGIVLCHEKAREQAPGNSIAKLWFKLRGDGGDDLGGFVQDALAKLSGGER